MKLSLIALSLTLISLQGCANVPPTNAKINVSPDTLDCIVNDLTNHTLSECSREYMKACEPFIK